MTLPAPRLRPTTAARDCSSNYLPGLFAKTICQDYLRASPAIVHSDFCQSAPVTNWHNARENRPRRPTRLARSAHCLAHNRDRSDRQRPCWRTFPRIAPAAGVADAEVRLEIWPHMIHALPVWNAKLDDGPRALASAGRFVRAHIQRPRQRVAAPVMAARPCKCILRPENADSVAI